MTHWPVVLLPPPEDKSGLSLTYVCLVDHPHALASVIAFRSTVPIASLDWDISSDGQIVTVEVQPDWQRKGVATRMLGVAEDISRDEGWPVPAHGQPGHRRARRWALSLEADPP